LLSINLTLASRAFAQTKKQVLGIASNYASTLGIKAGPRTDEIWELKKDWLAK